MNVVFLRLLSVNVEGLFELRGGLAYIFWPGVMEGCYYFYGNIISILPIYIYHLICIQILLLLVLVLVLAPVLVLLLLLLVLLALLLLAKFLAR